MTLLTLIEFIISLEASLNEKSQQTLPNAVVNKYALSTR